MEEIMNLALKDERDTTKRDITNMIREAQKIANEKWSYLSSDNIIYLIQTV